ncbi:hypothetical protein E2562_031457 [Oryza meyeriana var. granulata]|uniref:Uncharacterized protein n=1 Tax=Oryza meyeriana var. granulata TaxID=110450 RepID=A0A6G1BP35_9ORYZ|nr:hypothetical protein E2562_031457 [Oryza meyeriana var. granulata]
MPRRRRRAASGGRVPPELRLAYGARALPLGRAVFSLLPSPRQRESPCPACRGRAASGCLVCRLWEHLLRDGDPVAYRRLVTRAVCAVAADAPPPPRYTPGNSGHSQARVCPAALLLSAIAPALLICCLGYVHFSSSVDYLRQPFFCLHGVRLIACSGDDQVDRCGSVVYDQERALQRFA